MRRLALRLATLCCVVLFSPASWAQPAASFHIILLAGQSNMAGRGAVAAEDKVDAAHQAVAKKMKNVYFVSAEGLVPKGDNVHFNAESLHEFGKRFATVYLEATKK